MTWTPTIDEIEAQVAANEWRATHDKPEPTGIEATLAERATRYGAFTDHARITQGLKYIMTTGRRWRALADDQKEALEMVAHKIGRILNGDPDYADSWHDICGYVKLVEDRLNGKVQ